MNRATAGRTRHDDTRLSTEGTRFLPHVGQEVSPWYDDNTRGGDWSYGNWRSSSWRDLILQESDPRDRTATSQWEEILKNTNSPVSCI